MPDVAFAPALREALQEALERMFFVRDLGEAAPGGEAGPEVAVRVDFEGSPSGYLTLRAGLAPARSLAADFLGENEEAMSDAQTREVLAELANIVCGAVLTRTESATIFRLSSPRAIPASDCAKLDLSLIHI